jgi:pyruvate,orthophosphate dikinase
MIYSAAATVAFAEGVNVYPEILIPQVFSEREIDNIRIIIMQTAKEVFDSAGYSIPYYIGTMIDNPRACMRADFIIKKGVDLLCLDVDRLTENIFGCSQRELNRIFVSLLYFIIFYYILL